jgi:hypothetical protein
MGRMRRLGILFTAVALAMTLAVPGMAQGPKHTSCKDFGHLFALFAQNPELFGVSNAGEGISFNARNEVELFGQTFTPPGSIAAIVHYEQNELGFCESP